MIYIVVDWRWQDYFEGTLQGCQRWIRENNGEGAYRIVVEEDE